MFKISWLARTEVGAKPGDPSFSLLCLSAWEPNGATRLSYFILADQTVCFGAAYHLHPRGTVLQPFNYSMPQTRWFKSDKRAALLGGRLPIHLLSCQQPQPGGGVPAPTPSPRGKAAYAMMLKQSLLDSCSSSRRRRECWIWIMYMELVTEISSSITTLKRNTSFKRRTESLR